MEGFTGLNSKQSVEYQLKKWVEGTSLHNPVRDECCPDFSCCNGNIMPVEAREKFAEAYANDDESTMWSILGMGLAGLASDNDINIHVAGEDGTEN